jgi:SAM-dependent methyltransferase
MNSESNVVELFPKIFATRPLLAPKLIEQIRLGMDVDDATFDQIFPPYYQFQSPTHWSSIRVARQIADWIKPLGHKSIIDIGCGVGKLCLLLRILTNYEIFGIEQRSILVSIANKIIGVNDFKNISIIQMNMLELNWDLHDIYYLYNPFLEHLADAKVVLENDIEFHEKYYAHYTSEVFRQLTWAKPGKVLITFHGYGGNVPSTWRMVASKYIEEGYLSMWIKESP